MTGGTKPLAKGRPSNVCGECGMALDSAAQFHPHAFCVLKQANPRSDPWTEFRWCVERVMGVSLPLRAPLIRDLPLPFPTEGTGDVEN